MPRGSFDPDIIEEQDLTQIKVLPHQKQVINSDARTVAVLGGNQSGKTIAVIFAIIKTITKYPEEAIYVGTPILDQLRRNYLRKLKKVLQGMGLFDPTDPQSTNKTEKKIKLLNGSIIYYFSTSDPEKLQGVTTPLIAIDEIQNVESARILDIAQERVNIMRGQVYISGLVPHPNNLLSHWLYDRIYKPWTEGAEDIDLFNFASADNPFFPKERLEQAKKELPKGIYLAEYEGEFVESTLTDNVFVPSSVEFAIRRWQERIQYLPKTLYQFTKGLHIETEVPDYIEENIAKAQGSYLTDLDEEHELFKQYAIYRSRYGKRRWDVGDKKKDYEVKDPEAGIIKYGLTEEAEPLLVEPEFDPKRIILGVDVADEGGDENVVTIRWGNTTLTQQHWIGSTDKTVDRLIPIYDELDQLGYQVEFYIDCPGLGKDVYNWLDRRGLYCHKYWPSDDPPGDSKRYLHKKAWLFFEIRKRLLRGNEAFPKISKLRRQMLKQKYKYNSQNKINIRKDSKDSPDYADSYIISTLGVHSAVNPLDQFFVI